MTRGRKPLPTNVKKFRGNPGKRPLNSKEPTPGSRATIPDWLAGDEVAVAEWNRLEDELGDLGLLTALDQVCFAMYCDAYSRFVRSRDKVDRFGEILQSKKAKDDPKAGAGDGLYQSPFLPVMRKEREFLKVLISLLGLSPSDRTRIEVEEPTEAEELARKYFDR